MKKIFILMLMLSFIFISCTETSESDDLVVVTDERFAIEYQQTVDNRYQITIFVDKNTGVKYMWVIDSNWTGRSGLCRLEPTYKELKSQH